MYRVLLVDDDAQMLQINGEYLRGEGYLTDFAASVSEAREKIIEHRPDCIVMDVMMPGMDGFDGIRYLRRQTDAPILFFTAKAEEEDRIRGLMMGADDYIVKPCSLKELSLRIMIHIRRRQQTEQRSGILEFAPLRIDLEAHRVYCNGEEILLANREWDFLLCLARHPGMTMSFEDIGRELYGSYRDSDRKNIMVNVSRLRKKLEGYAGLDHMIETVWGKGYCWRAK